jgi:hypothetical protein
MKNITYQNDEPLKKMFKKLKNESPSAGFSERVMNMIIQPELDMSAHQQTINLLLWSVIASIAIIIPVLFFLLDWSVFDLFTFSISADNFNHFIIFLSNLPEYFSSLLAGLKQYSLLFIISAAGFGLLFIDSLLSKSLMRNFFPFIISGHDVK